MVFARESIGLFGDSIGVRGVDGKGTELLAVTVGTANSFTVLRLDGVLVIDFWGDGVDKGVDFDLNNAVSEDIFVGELANVGRDARGVSGISNSTFSFASFFLF